MPRTLRVLLVTASLLAVTACAAVVDRRGFVSDDGAAATATVGTDTKSTLIAKYGNPTSQGTFDGQVWYYISAVQNQVAFYNPRTVERQITAIRFDDMDTVSEVRTYGLRDGKVFAYDDRRTPTRGREVTFLEQLFGSVGRAPVQLPGQDPNLPDSAGGPRRQ
jgi:outer membrane protein assembly factor BamE (lipoprotein component of BamABCDE complex)